MIAVSDVLKELLDRQGIGAGSLAGDYAQGKIARTAGAGAAGIGAGDQSGGTDRLLTGLREGGDRNPMGMGKGTPTEAGASQQGGRKGVYQEPSPARGCRPVLRVVVDNSRNWRTQAPRVAPLGVRQFLALVQ